MSFQGRTESVIGKDAAIRAATYHRDRATSPALARYWDSVIVSIERGK
jgi:hypothetical protein